MSDEFVFSRVTINDVPTFRFAELRDVEGGLELLAAAEKLLEWCPVCSEWSSGNMRQVRLRDAIKKLKKTE